MTFAVALLLFGLRQVSSAEKLISDIHAITQPPLTGSDEAAIAKWEADGDAAFARQGELILKLYSAYPSRPEVPELLYDRWKGMEGHRAPCSSSRLDRIDAEVQAFLSKPQIEQNREAGLLALARLKLLRQWRALRDAKLNATDKRVKPYLTTALKAIDAFSNRYPKVELCVFQYYNFSQMAKGSEYEAVGLERIVSRYPSHRLASSAKGRLRDFKLLGKPLDLRFSDVLTGSPIDLKDYRGKVVLVDFWATWCAPCKVEIESELIDLAKRLEPRGFAVIGISVDLPEAQGGKEMLLAYIKQKQIPWPNFYSGQPQGQGPAAKFGVSSFPTQFLIDRQGNLRSLDASKNLVSNIEQLLAETPNSTK